jgi:hypothetical protein
MVQEMLIIQVEIMDVIKQVRLHHQLGMAFLVQLEQCLQVLLYQRDNAIRHLLVGIVEFIHVQLVVQLQASFVTIFLVIIVGCPIQYQ